MRKEVQNNSRRNPKLLREKKDNDELVETVAVRHQDQLVYTSALQKSACFISVKNPDQLQTPNMMVFDRLGKIVRCRPAADDRHVSNIKRSVFGNFHQNDTV